MVNGIRTGDPHGFNEERRLKFCVGSQVWQTPEEGRRTYQLKCCGNNNKDEDNSKKKMIKIIKLRLRNSDKKDVTWFVFNGCWRSPLNK